MNHWGILLLSVVFLCASNCAAADFGKQDEDASRTEEIEKLLSLAREKGVIKVIIELKVPEIEKLTRSAAMLKDSNEIAKSQRDIAERITKIADSLIDQIKNTHYRINRRYRSLPHLALDVSVEALEILKASPDVRGIEKDILVPLIENFTTY